MNAVTTAEYVVLESLSEVALEQDINEQAAKGYKLVVFTSTPSTTEHDKTYNAVMVRETVSTELLNRIADLETRLQALDANYENTRQQVISHESVRLGTRSRLDSLEARCNDIEAKIDWSK